MKENKTIKIDIISIQKVIWLYAYFQVQARETTVKKTKIEGVEGLALSALYAGARIVTKMPDDGFYHYSLNEIPASKLQELLRLEIKRTWQQFWVQYEINPHKAISFLNYIQIETQQARTKLNKTQDSVLNSYRASGKIVWKANRGVATVKLVTDLVQIIWDKTGISSMITDTVSDVSKNHHLDEKNNVSNTVGSSIINDKIKRIEDNQRLYEKQLLAKKLENHSSKNLQKFNQASEEVFQFEKNLLVSRRKRADKFNKELDEKFHIKKKGARKVVTGIRRFLMLNDIKKAIENYCNVMKVKSP